MQLTKEKPGKVVMSKWEYALGIALVYFAGYANGRTGWATLLHDFGWHTLTVPLILLLVAIPRLLWMWWKRDTRSG